MADPAPIDPSRRLRAERRLLEALRRLHRREPMRPDQRIDVLLDAVRGTQRRAAAGHRGSDPAAVSDATLRHVLDGLVAAGQVVRRGRHLRLREHAPALGPEMRRRSDQLLALLRDAGNSPPRVDGPAARLGIPPAVVDQLRATGELVAVAPGIDYPGQTWAEIGERLDRLAESEPLTVARVRDELGTSRRYAVAILSLRAAPART